MSAYVMLPSQIIVHQGNLLKHAVQRAVQASSAGREAWQQLVRLYDEAHPAQQPTPASVTEKTWRKLVQTHTAQRMRTELKSCGLFWSEKRSETLRVGIRVSKKGPWHGTGASTYFRILSESSQGGRKRNRIAFHITVRAPSYAHSSSSFEHGIPFVIEDKGTAGGLIVTVASNVGATLVVDYYTGGLDDLPGAEKRLASGDRLLELHGEKIGTWTEKEFKEKLFGAVYPLTYLFERDMRGEKYKQWMAKQADTNRTLREKRVGPAISNHRTALPVKRALVVADTQAGAERVLRFGGEDTPQDRPVENDSV